MHCLFNILVLLAIVNLYAMGLIASIQTTKFYNESKMDLSKLNIIQSSLPLLHTINNETEYKKSGQILIINGEGAKPHEFPFMVLLIMQLEKGSDRGAMCGGTLIKLDMVLSAGHCAYPGGSGHFPYHIEARLGYHNIRVRSRGNQNIQVKSAHVHPNYADMMDDTENQNVYHDIVIFKLFREADMTSEKVATIELDTSSRTLVGRFGNIIGWGLTEQEKTSDVLQKVNLQIVSKRECEIKFGNKLLPSQLCIFDKRKSPCQGDSGGPLFSKDGNGNFIQLGIVSYGAQGCLGKPMVCTRVSSHTHWINNYENGSGFWGDWEDGGGAIVLIPLPLPLYLVVILTIKLAMKTLT